MLRIKYSIQNPGGRLKLKVPNSSRNDILTSGVNNPIKYGVIIPDMAAIPLTNAEHVPA